MGEAGGETAVIAGPRRLVLSLRARPAWLLIAFLVGFAFAVPILISAFIFPVLSNNPDETVYLVQAKLLAQGRLFMEPNQYSEFFSPFFFFNDGDKIFSKYSPVHAAILAIGEMVAGSPRLSLGLLGAANLAVIWLLGRELYGRREGLIAAVVLAFSAWFLIHSSTYLSYTSSLLFNALFLLAFLKWQRTNRPAWALGAGLAIGIEFFARPYSAILFSAPFAVWALILVARDHQRIMPLAAMVAGATSIIALALAYNTVITGNPLLFPFQALEPLDTLGFGARRTHPSAPLFDFTPEKGVRATVTALRSLGMWLPGGALGALFIALRLYFAPLRRGEIALLAVIGSVVVGNVFFWGTAHLVTLGAHDIFGPFYHFDLLVPYTLLFVGSIGVAASWVSKLPRPAWMGRASRWVPAFHGDMAGGLTAVAAALVVIYSIGVLGSKLELNYRYTTRDQELYAPIWAATSGSHESLVFLPVTLIGLPLNDLINDPDLDGSVVYARDLGPKNLRLMEAYPGRRYYRFTIQGAVTASYSDWASSSIKEVRLERANEFDVRTTIVNDSGKPFVFVYVWNEGNVQEYLVDDDSRRGETYELTWNVAPEGMDLVGDFLRQLSEMDGPAEEGVVTFAVAFSDVPERERGERLEYRYWMRVEDGEIVFADPPQQWRNTSWTNRKWVESEVGPAMVISLENPVTITGGVSDE